MKKASNMAYVSKRKLERYQEERAKWEEKIRVWKESGADPALYPVEDAASDEGSDKEEEKKPVGVQPQQMIQQQQLQSPMLSQMQGAS